MPERTHVLNQSLLRCHLKALIEMAGSKIPRPRLSHPVPEKLTANELLDAVELYRLFLRSGRSI